MMENLTLALIGFGLILAIALYGLARSNQAARRNNASTDGRQGSQETYSPTNRAQN